jgi:hypothetical protein
VRGPAAQLGGVIGRARWAVEDRNDRGVVDGLRSQFETIERTAVVKAGAGFSRVGEAGAQVCVLVGAQGAEIPQRKVL